jgi:hypothetical protein
MVAKTKAPEAAQAPLTYTDLHGAVISIPADTLGLYAGVKAEQLKAITQVLKEDAFGDLGLDSDLRNMLVLVADEYAHAVNEISDLVGGELHRLAKRGEAAQ